MKVAFGNGPATVPAAAVPLQEITIKITATPVSTVNQDLLSFVSLETPQGGRVMVHMPWNNGLVWQFGDAFASSHTPMEAEWLGVRAHYTFSASAPKQKMYIYRDGVKLAESDQAHALTLADDLVIGGRAEYPFQGVIHEWEIHDKLPEFPWGWMALGVVGLGLLIARSRRK